MEKVVCGSCSMGQGSKFYGWRITQGRCACRFIGKDHKMNSVLKHPNPNNYQKNMK
jgi:hypothetical protein